VRVPTSDPHTINACWFLFLLFVYLLVTEAASFDKKELCRSDTITIFNKKVRKLKQCLKVQVVARNVLLHACRTIWNASITQCLRSKDYRNTCMLGKSSELQLKLELTDRTPP
jgi:hypothetical protein